MVVQVGTVAACGEFLPDAIDVGLQCGIVVDLVLFAHFRIGGPAQGDLLRFRHHHEIFLPADGVGGTAAQCQCANDDQRRDETTHDVGPEKKKAACAAFFDLYSCG